MILKGLIDEDFVNFYLPSMYLAFPNCSWKCDRGLCQNSPLTQSPNIEISTEKLVERFFENPISKAFVFAGLEPFDSFSDMKILIKQIRDKDKKVPIVIYTGYTEEEIKKFYSEIFDFSNLIIKYGRYIPNQKPHYDSILKVKLASDNQYAKWINKESEN